MGTPRVSIFKNHENAWREKITHTKVCLHCNSNKDFCRISYSDIANIKVEDDIDLSITF